MKFAAVAALVVALAVYYFHNGGPVLAIPAFIGAVWLVGSALAELADRIKLFAVPFSHSMARAAVLPRAAWGMTLAHAGLGVMVAGMTGTALWTQERIQAMAPGDSVELAGYQVRLESVAPVQGPNYEAMRGSFSVLDKSGTLIATLTPERRIVHPQEQAVTNIGIRTNFFADFLQKDPPLWLDRMMEEIHAGLDSRAHFLVHRDFHVRNLMVHGDRLITLDFQDARKGAATYDLASILFDGYWDWSEEAREVMVSGVREELGWSEALLWEELNLSAIQRNFKALGTFAHQIIHQNKPHFAPAIPRTLKHLLGHFQRTRQGEAVLALEHWLRISEKRLLKTAGGGLDLD